MAISQMINESLVVTDGVMRKDWKCIILSTIDNKGKIGLLLFP